MNLNQPLSTQLYFALFVQAQATIYFPAHIAFCQESKDGLNLFRKHTLRRWLIFLFSFTLRTFWTLKQPLSNHGTIALNALLLFRGYDNRARIAFRRRVKFVKNIVRKHTQFIKG